MLVAALRAAEIGDYERLRHMVRSGNGTAVLAGVVTQFAEPVRGVYARTTSRALIRLGEAAEFGGRGGIALNPGLADAPYALGRSPAASNLLEWHEHRHSGLVVPPRRPYLPRQRGRRAETPAGLADRAIAQMRHLGLIVGLLSERGGKQAALDEIVEATRRLLQNPTYRAWLFRR